MARVSQAYLDARRSEIMKAAERCFVRQGFDASSMRDIVQQAGISSGAVYRYFASKDELIVAVMHRAVEGMTAGLREAAAARSADEDLPPAELFERLLRFFERNPDGPILRLQVEHRALLSPVVAEAFLDGERKVEQILVDVIESYQARGMMSPAIPAADVATALHGLLDAHAVTWTLYGKRHMEAFHRGVRALVVGLTNLQAGNGQSP